MVSGLHTRYVTFEINVYGIESSGTYKPASFFKRKAQDNLSTNNFLDFLEGTRKEGQSRVW